MVDRLPASVVVAALRRLASVITLALAATTAAAATFVNPIVAAGAAGAADPSVVFFCGHYYYYYYYYCRATDDRAIAIARARWLQDIGAAPLTVVFSAPAGTPYSKQVWAPELQRVRGH
jgi:GH43 family beta-xylosidase